MSSPEFTEWQAFHAIEPFGDWWRGIGDLCSVVINAVGSIWGAPSRWWLAEDWMPGQAEVAEGKRQQMQGEMGDSLQQLAEAER